MKQDALRRSRRRRFQLAVRRDVRRRLLLRRGLRRGVTRRTVRMQRQAHQTLSFIKKGIVNALWTAVVVIIVKLAPLLLLGIKLMFKSMVPLAGMAVFQERQDVFRDGFDLAPDPIQATSSTKTNLQKNDTDMLDELNDDELLDAESEQPPAQDPTEDEVDLELDETRSLSDDDNDEAFY